MTAQPVSRRFGGPTAHRPERDRGFVRNSKRTLREDLSGPPGGTILQRDPGFNQLQVYDALARR